MKYKIETPNKNYNGNTWGVKFENGISFVKDEIVKNILVNEFNYSYEVINECLEDSIEVDITVELQQDDSIEDIDYNSMKFNDLKKLCSEKNIKVENTYKKEDLINLLQEVK